MTAKRSQIKSSDAQDPESLRSVLNELLLELYSRLEALEAVKGLTVLPPVSFETGASLGPTVAPFLSGGVRVACPFSPTGLVLLMLETVRSPSVSSLASDVKWHFASGTGPGDGVLHIDFVTGLLASTSYRMRVGVTRA